MEQPHVDDGIPNHSGDPLDTLRDRLYATEAPPVLREGMLAREASAPITGWDRTPAPEPKKKLAYTTIFLLAATGFFVIAASAAAFMYFRGTSAITSDKIIITVTSPTPTIASGDTVPLIITVRNDNPTAISNTNLMVTFPEGTREDGTSGNPKQPYADTLGDIPAGGEVTRTVPAVFFGSQNQILTIPLHFQYQVAGSRAIFNANATHTLSISTSPVSVRVNTLSETASGQPFSVTVEVHSNAAVPLKDIAVVATYPTSGYELKDANPAPRTGGFFMLGSLAPGETKNVRLNGVLTGIRGDQRTFAFAVGAAREDGTSVLAAPYTSTKATLAVTEPFLGTTLSLNRETAETVIAAAGGRIDAAIKVQNNLSVPVSNVIATIALTGEALNPASVTAVGGFYRSTDRTVIFSSENTRALASLQAGDSSVGTFSFSAKPASQLKNIQNPTITATVSVSGMRLGQGSVPQSITSTVIRTIKIGTDIALTRALLHTEGPYANTGPVPPRAGVETSYTVVLGASNSLNRVGGGKATMTLPSYVRYTRSANPASAFTYDEASRTVNWNVGEFGPNASASASFQIAVVPSTSQVNTSPVVVGPVAFTGTDTFSTVAVTAELPALTLASQSDAGFTPSSGTIQN